MHDSILETVKKLIGGEQYGNAFDLDLITFINAAFMLAKRIGVGPQDETYSIQSSEETWSDYLGESEKNLKAVQSYISLRVRLMFDPPTGSVLTAMQENMRELESTLLYEVDRDV